VFLGITTYLFTEEVLFVIHAGFAKITNICASIDFS
jgi:hypothetical protein